MCSLRLALLSALFLSSAFLSSACTGSTAGPAAAEGATDESGGELVYTEIEAFVGEPQFNASGEPMIMLLKVTRAIPPGTRVSELLEKPSRYLEVRWLDPSDPQVASRDWGSTASFGWLMERPEMIVETSEFGLPSTLFQANIVDEEFVDVVVAARPIDDGAPFDRLLNDLDQWTRMEPRATWQVEQETWLSPTGSSRAYDDLNDFNACVIDGDLRPGDPIVFKGPWYLGVQQLRVTQTIPAGTSVEELVAQPTVYLSARIDQGCEDRTLIAIAELMELQGLVAIRTIETGEDLDVGQFGPAG